MVYDILGQFGTSLLKGDFYQQGAANTLVPQQTQLARSEIGNQQGFYDAQNQLAQSEGVSNNPFLQMLTRQLSPKMSPSDVSLRGLAFGMANPNDTSGLAKQFSPMSAMSLTPSNVATIKAQELMQQGMNPQDAMYMGYQYANAARNPVELNPVTGDYFNPAEKVLGNTNPVVQANAPKQQAPMMQPQQPLGQTNGYLGNQQNGLPPVKVNQPQMPVDLGGNNQILTESNVSQPMSLEQKQQASGLPPKQFYEETNRFADFENDATNTNNANARLTRMDSANSIIPQIESAMDSIAKGETPTGYVEQIKNIGGGVLQDIFGTDSLSPDALTKMSNQSFLDIIGSRQALENAVTYLKGQGSVTENERKDVKKLGANLTSNESRNLFALGLTKITTEASATKDALYDQYITEAGSNKLPAFGFKNFNEYYRNWQAQNKQPFMAKLSSEIGRSIGELPEGGEFLNISKSNMPIIRSIAVDAKTLSEEDFDKTMSMENAIIKSPNGYFKIINGQPIAIKVNQ